MNKISTHKNEQSFDGVIFDCDSTLSTIEGIDELADIAGVKTEVEQLTNQAMNGDIALEDIYGKRLALIKPTRAQVKQISDCYLANIVTGAKEIINTLQQRHINVAIISGGLYDAIVPLAEYLGVDKQHLFAVNISYDRQGNYDHLIPSPLTTAKGKYDVCKHWKQSNKLQRVALIGDGVSDVAALGAADIVIGYGGVVRRRAVEESATYFYAQRDLMGILNFL